jgi:ATP-binding cassette subfamily B protein
MSAAEKAPQRPQRGPGGGGPGMAMLNGEKPKDFKTGFKKLMIFLAPFKVRIILVVLASMLSTVLTQFVPKILANVTNEVSRAVMERAAGGVGEFDYGIIDQTIFLMLGFYIFSLLISFFQGYTMTTVTTKIAYNLRNTIMIKINKLPVGFFHSMSHGEVLSRITNDVDTMSQNLTQSITQAITTVVTLIVSLSLMITISWQLTLVALLMIPGSALCTLFMVKVSQKYFRAQQKLLGTVNGAVEEIFSGHTVIKAFNAEQRAMREFNEQNDKLYNTAWKAQFLTGLMMPMMNFIGNLGYVVVCMYGALLISKGVINVGDIQAFITYIRSFTQPITQLANISSQLQSTAAAAERVFAFIDESDELDINTIYDIEKDPINGDVTFEHVRFAYEYIEKDEDEEGPEAMFKKMQEKMEAKMAKKGKKGAPGGFPGGSPGGPGGFPGFGDDKKKVKKLAGAEEEEQEIKKKKSGEPVIHDFSATIKAGQKVAIVGPTGAGKTTMVKLLMRFHDIQSGRILVDGRDITNYARRDLRKEFGMVLQDTWLYNDTIMENIRYGKLDATDEEVIAAAKAAQVDHFVRTLPEGYEMVLNEESTNISQGQKQLLTIARAILADSKILILDEATSSVDTRTEILIQRAMDNLLEGRTSFIIAHRLSTIRNADLILCMRDGDIVEQGTHEELLAAKGFYADLYNSQFEDVEAS